MIPLPRASIPTSPLDTPSLTAGEQLAREAGLFTGLDAGGPGESMHVWESSALGVVLGRSGSAGRDAHEDACRGDGVAILKRFSGGGAVVIGPGCLNYSLLLSLEKRPELRDVARSYELILGRILEALRVPGLAIRGGSDLVIGGRKVGGCAQRRGRRALLHHGTLLYAFDARLMERYLRQPLRQPAYRAGRRHGDFVANLPLACDVMRRGIAAAWGL